MTGSEKEGETQKQKNDERYFLFDNVNDSIETHGPPSINSFLIQKNDNYHPAWLFWEKKRGTKCVWFGIRLSQWCNAVGHWYIHYLYFYLPCAQLVFLLTSRTDGPHCGITAKDFRFFFFSCIFWLMCLHFNIICGLQWTTVRIIVCSYDGKANGKKSNMTGRYKNEFRR